MSQHKVIVIGAAGGRLDGISELIEKLERHDSNIIEIKSVDFDDCLNMTSLIRKPQYLSYQKFTKPYGYNR